MEKKSKKNQEIIKGKKVKKEKKTKKNFWKNFKVEVSKIKWPDGKEVLKYTIATLVFVVILALFFQALYLLEAFIKGLFV